MKDFAIFDGNNSCYGGPSYQVYLAEQGGFRPDKEFTALAQQNCGLFAVNHEKKLIQTMTKSGCCHHETSTYRVENNKLKLIKEVVEESGGVLSVIKVRELKGARMASSEMTLFDSGEANVCFTFDLLKSRKRVVVFTGRTQGGELQYALTKGKERVEFAYPLISADAEDSDRSGRFTLDTGKDEYTLDFSNGSANYQIFEGRNAKDVGIRVTEDKKTTLLKGDASSKKGSLKKLASESFENLDRAGSTGKIPDGAKILYSFKIDNPPNLAMTGDSDYDRCRTKVVLYTDTSKSQGTRLFFACLDPEERLTYLYPQKDSDVVNFTLRLSKSETTIFLKIGNLRREVADIRGIPMLRMTKENATNSSFGNRSPESAPLEKLASTPNSIKNLVIEGR